MELKRKNLCLFFILSAFSLAQNAFALAIPDLNGRPVVDSAQIIDDATEDALNRYLIATSEQTGVQVAVFTIPTLNGASIEEYSLAAAEKWQLGRKGEDDGVLLTVALEEHALRIEVGYGLEGKLTDTKCGLIIRNFITPAFRNEQYSEGIKTGVEKIVGVATDNAEINSELIELAENDGAASLADFIIPLIFFLIFFSVVTSSQGYGPFGLLYWYGLLTGTPIQRKIYTAATPSATTFTSGAGHSSFHSSGFSSGGGHSFGGGGGGFGGGGASGRW